MAALDTLSSVFGWVYFCAWSCSFYPQFILNWRRKSVQGLSLEFQVYNITGFLFYSIYTVVGYVSQRDFDLTRSVTESDIAFAVHAFCIQSLVCIQCLLFKRPDHTVNKVHATICGAFWLIALYNIALSFGGFLPWRTTTDVEYPYNTVAFLGYVKSAISLIKYMPQAYMNYERKSTVGWSIGNILLDFTGGTFSFLQQFVDAKRQDDWGVFTKNVPKLLLSLISLFFDILFILQHYVFYRNSRDMEQVPDEEVTAAFSVPQSASGRLGGSGGDVEQGHGGMSAAARERLLNGGSSAQAVNAGSSDSSRLFSYNG